ncbi:MAG: hypothetical protein ACI920_003543 [Saprospiraceae bacterium]
MGRESVVKVGFCKGMAVFLEGSAILTVADIDMSSPNEQ